MVSLKIPNKKTYELTVGELDRKALSYKILFYIYGIIAVASVIIGAFVLNDLLDFVIGISDSPSMTALLLFSFISLVNFFLLFFIWFTNESGYYRNQQMLVEIMMLLKGKRIL